MAEVSNEMYERLRHILQKQNGRKYTSEEAKEIGDVLIDFYTLLAELSEDNSDPQDRTDDTLT